MENGFIALVEGFTFDGVFKFGKHKGRSFVEVATSLKEPDYFLWLKRNIYDKLDFELKMFIDDNIEKLKSLPVKTYEREGDWGDYMDSF